LPTGAHHVERFEHGGATLVDEVLGDSQSPHLVLMHGWGATRDSLRGIGVLFERTHCVHLLDLPGFGEAPPPPDGWDTVKYSALVGQYLQERLTGTAVLVGHSFGGRIAIRLAAGRLPGIGALVLMGVPGLPGPRFSRARVRRAAAQTLRRFLRAARPVTGPGPLDWHTRTFGSRDYLAAGPLRPVFVRVVNEDLTESARAVACPVLLLWGSDDRETPPWLASRYRELMGGRPVLQLLPHKDHYLFDGTGSHLCAFKIRSWLSSHVER
jgi:pimeloyl-ACP methyl ester carboxylesterase